MKPSRAILQRIADASYSATPPSSIETFSLVRATPTLKVYRDGDVFVVGIRGTRPTDIDDLKADGAIAVGLLSQTARYKRDEDTLRQVKLEFPSGIFYGVGHSLGGAILDEFLKRGLVTEGLSYNPAVQPTDFKRGLPNTRIYQEGDPLYEVMGKNVEGVEVRKPKSPALLRLLRLIPYVGTLLSAVASHRLENFAGGATHRENVLRKYKLPDEGYSVGELAKRTGVPRRVLQAVYNRGIGAYKTNPTSVRLRGSFKKNVVAPMSRKLSKEQWAMARVYSFLDGNPKHDTDLRGGMDAGEPVVNSPCGLHTLLTLKENGFPKIEIPEIAGRMVAIGDRGGMTDSVLEKAVEPYVAMNVEAREDVFPSRELTQILRQMEANELPGMMFLRGDDDPESSDHVVPILVRDGKLTFHDGDTDIYTIDTSKPLDENEWWDRAGYDAVYEGVDRMIVLSPLRGSGRDAFEQQLGEVGYNPSEYLKEARRRAKSFGYDPSSLSFARNGVHKLLIVDDAGRSHRFGRVGYGDHLIWSHRERRGDVPKGTAASKRSRFVKSHSAMKGNWKANPYSPNNLAIRILW